MKIPKDKIKSPFPSTEGKNDSIPSVDVFWNEFEHLSSFSHKILNTINVPRKEIDSHFKGD